MLTALFGGRRRRCPFCGSNDLFENYNWIRCERCKAEGPLARYESPWAAWNRRKADCDHVVAVFLVSSVAIFAISFFLGLFMGG